MTRATRLEADAFILDLEDAVPLAQKDHARRQVASAVEELSAAGRGVIVRVNGLDTGHWLADLQAVVRPGLTAVAVPKVRDTGEIAAVAHVLSALESTAGLQQGSIDIQPLIETARGMRDAFAILSSSERIRSYFAGVARDADVERELGSRWTREGRESLYVRSKLLLDGRAAGVPYPITGTWLDLDDTDGFEKFAREGRQLGYTGMYVIHPSHVAEANRAFSPSREELDRLRTIVTLMDEAEREGIGAIELDGTMVDVATVARARDMLALAADLGLEDSADGVLRELP